MKQKLIQERPNTDVAFFTNTAQAIAKLKEYTDAGKITASESMSENQLVKTTELIYASNTDFIDFGNEQIGVIEKENRESYCDENNISFNLTRED